MEAEVIEQPAALETPSIEVKPSVTTTEVQQTPLLPHPQWPMYPMYNYDMSNNYYQYYLMNYPAYQNAIYHQVQQQMLENNKTDNNKFIPPLPPGPVPPGLNNIPHIQKPPLLNTPKQFNSPIRFNINGKRFPNGNLQQKTSLNSGSAKKKRKRNRNLQNQNQNFAMPPLPPPEQSIPKPAPPPETMPPSPPLPPLPDTTKPPPQQMPEDAPPPPPSPLIPPTTNNPADEWPPSLKDYVSRCYAKCKTNIDKNQVEIILKGKITHAYQMGQLHTKDWTNEPLPNIHSERPSLITKTVPGTLAQYQTSPKKGLSVAMGARLGARASTLRGISRSSSRSRSGSPLRKKSRSRSRSPRRHQSSR